MDQQSSTPAKKPHRVDYGSVTSRLVSPIITALIVFVLGFICLTLM